MVALGVVVNMTPLRLRLGIKLLEFGRDELERLHAAVELEQTLVGVELLGPQAVIGRQEANTGEHRLTENALSHVCRDQTAK